MNNTTTQASPADNGRLHPRTHLFVIATLYADSGSAPVHVRNMSQTGALIESAVLPRPGTSVKLKRGSLQASGRIVWKAGKRAGVSFTGDIHVAEWMLKTTGPQDQIDRIVSDFRANRQSDPAASGQPLAPKGHCLRSELDSLRADLTQLGNLLSNDVILIATHPELQLLDISVQRIDQLIKRL